MAFLTSLRKMVGQAVDLKPNVESQVVLDLKGELEKLYEIACGLADDHTGNKTAIRQLISVIMGTIQRGATGDSLAEQELAQEDEARATHFELLEHSLIADLLHPESLVMEDELVPVLLSEEEAQVEAALGLFDREQLSQIKENAEALLHELAADREAHVVYWQNLEQIRNRLDNA